MRKLKSLLLVIMILSVFLMNGCKSVQETDEEEEQFKIYFIDPSGMELQGVNSDIGALEQDKRVGGILETMREDRGGCLSPFPYEVRVKEFSLSDKKLVVDFNAAYNNMDTVTEVLLRAAIVLTMTQLEEVDYVTFKVNGTEYVDNNGKPIGIMTASDFVNKVGVSINNYESVVITLYFSNYTGSNLKTEVISKMYDSSKPLEKYIMEQLLAGPTEKGDYKVMPSGTKILDVYTNDGICYVDFNNKFLDGPSTVNDNILIYSIVNSLTELSYVNQVQISVEGDVDVKLHDKISLNTFFSRDLSYMER